jgi:hypothetical protein
MKRKVQMDNKKRNVQVESDGNRSVLVPLWRELPQITVRLKEGNTIYRFTASFDGMHTLPEKAVKLIDSEGSV